MKKILVLAFALTMVLVLTLVAPVAFADGAAFVVEKHPTTETVPVGGCAEFVSYPSGTGSYVTYWTFILSDGTFVRADDAEAHFYGLSIEIPTLQKIRLNSIPASMDGVRIQAHFVDLGTSAIIDSDPAYILLSSGSTNCQPAAAGTLYQQNGGGACIVTKHPVEEHVYNGKYSTAFIAHAQNAASVEWQCKIGESGQPFSAREAIDVYGANLSGIDSDTIYIYDLWSDRYNGWYFRAVFHGTDGSIVISDWAGIFFDVQSPQCACPIEQQQPQCPGNGCYQPAYCPPCYQPCYQPCVDTTVTYTHTVTDSVTTATTYYYGGYGCPEFVFG